MLLPVRLIDKCSLLSFYYILLYWIWEFIEERESEVNCCVNEEFILWECEYEDGGDYEW